MLIEIGHYALILALGLSLIGMLVSLRSCGGGEAPSSFFLQEQRGCLLGSWGGVAIAFALLTFSYVLSDFSVITIVENSHSSKPLLYKITGVWGNHEGALLLWVFILASFSLLIAFFSSLPASLERAILGLQAAGISAFLLLILLTANPFLRRFPPALEGRDLNPLLQDWGLALHPPLLYLGTVGFSVPFFCAVAALLTRSPAPVWARFLQLWSLVAWSFLTIGIMLGSYWAYYELGWGGWWFWDPVENVSLLPWLSGTALLHAALVTQKRGTLVPWTLFLAVITFSLVLMGLFLVRSGVLTSVHTFAVSPARGVSLLILFSIFVGGALGLFLWRCPVFQGQGSFSGMSREGGILFNTLFLTSVCATVLIGTLYPLFLETFTGIKISVGAPFFNLTLGWITAPLLLLLPFGPLLSWKKSGLRSAFHQLKYAGSLTLLVFGLISWVWGIRSFFLGAGLFLALWCIFGALFPLLLRLKKSEKSITRANYGSACAHGGVGVMLFGILATSLTQSETLLTLYPGEKASLGEYTLTYLPPRVFEGPNFQEVRFPFEVLRKTTVLGQVIASKRFYTSRASTTTEVGLFTRGVAQLYLSPGNFYPDQRLALHIQNKPFVLLIWGGGLMMALGGILVLSDRWRWKDKGERPSVLSPLTRLVNTKERQEAL